MDIITHSLNKVLSKDGRLLTFRPSLLQLTNNSVKSAILLYRIVYWYKKYGEFYKFKAPCGHNLYKKGDSWQEELGFKRSKLDTALRNIAIKVTKSNKNSKDIQKYLVHYRTDMNNVTWYKINTNYLRECLEGMYNNTPGNTPRKSTKLSYVNQQRTLIVLPSAFCI